MTKEYKTITKDISEYILELNKAAPETFGAFTNLAKAATADGALDKKTKELIALAIGVSSHCDGCIGFHVKALKRLDTTREEIIEVMSMAVYMGGGPSLMYAADALRAYDQL